MAAELKLLEPKTASTESQMRNAPDKGTALNSTDVAQLWSQPGNQQGSQPARDGQQNNNFQIPSDVSQRELNYHPQQNATNDGQSAQTFMPARPAFGYDCNNPNNPVPPGDNRTPLPPQLPPQAPEQQYSAAEQARYYNPNPYDIVPTQSPLQPLDQGVFNSHVNYPPMGVNIGMGMGMGYPGMCRPGYGYPYGMGGSAYMGMPYVGIGGGMGGINIGIGGGGYMRPRYGYPYNSGYGYPYGYGNYGLGGTVGGIINSAIYGRRCSPYGY